jgi:hypothetical protein
MSVNPKLSTKPLLEGIATSIGEKLGQFFRRHFGEASHCIRGLRVGIPMTHITRQQTES